MGGRCDPKPDHTYRRNERELGLDRRARIQSCQLCIEQSLPDFNDAVGILALFFRAGDMMKRRVDVVRQVYFDIL